MSESFWDNAEVISCYTRRQAIEDGALVDLMQSETESMVWEAGFKIPLAMTSAAYGACVAPIGGDLPVGQDLNGRLWDVLMLLRVAIAHTPQASAVHFTVRVWNGRNHDVVKLWSLCGPGDAGEPVITIMLEGED